MQKRGIVVVLVFSILFISLSFASLVSATCIDGESAVSYYVSGVVNYNGQNYPDSCSGDLLVEYSCVSGSLFTYPSHNCSLEGKICSNGACVLQNTSSGGSVNNVCDGCEYESRCIPVGYRFLVNDSASYCDIYGIALQKVNQENLTMSCQNSYECSSNICSSGECVNLEGFKAGVFKILCKIANFFDSDAEAACVAEYVYGACISSWDCTDWGACDGQLQNRVCNDTKSCSNSTNVPSLQQNCSIVELPVCGNGIIESGEECDSGTNTGYGCNENCTVESFVGFCGNNVREQGEECDDGNLVNGDGCSLMCLNETNVAVGVCLDSDNGLNFSIRGQINGLLDGDNETNSTYIENFSDYCLSLDSSMEVGEVLVEMYCIDSDNISFVLEDCVNGCFNGSCLISPPQCSATNPDDIYTKGYSSGLYNGSWYMVNQSDYCVDSFGTAQFVAGDVAKFSCDGDVLDYEIKNCVNGCYNGACLSEEPLCQDTDFGLDSYTKGQVNGILDGDNETNSTYVENVSDFCLSLNPFIDSGQFLVEGYCKNLSNIGSDMISCEYGCFDGSCLISPPQCSATNPDDIYTKGYSSGLYNGSWYMVNQSDYCVNDLENKTAEISGISVAKFGCDGNALDYEIKNCVNGCYLGACISTPAECISEPGEDIYTSGNSSGYLYGDLRNYMEMTDTCYYDENYTLSLQKFYCESSNVLNFSLNACQYGCFDGGCLNQSDYDSLMLQNNVGSYCLNVNITKPNTTQQNGGRICLDALGSGCNNRTSLLNETNVSKMCYTDLCPTRNAIDELRCNYRIPGANVSEIFNIWNTDYGDSYGNWVNARVNCSSPLCKSGPCDKYSDSNAPVINVSVADYGSYLVNYSLNGTGDVISKIYRCNSCSNGVGQNCVEADYYQDYLDSKCGDSIVQSWEECDNGTANVPARGDISCIGNPSCSNYNSDENTCNNALGGSVCSFSAGSASYCGSSSGPYGAASSAYCNNYNGNEYDCTNSPGGNCVYNWGSYTCDLIYSECSHWNNDVTYCSTMGCEWHEGVANSCLSSSERGCPWYQALLRLCPEAPSCSLKGDNSSCENSYGGACVFSKNSAESFIDNTSCEIGACGDGTNYQKYIPVNGQCTLACYSEDPCEGHEGIGLFGISSGGNLISENPIIGIGGVDDTKENCTYIPLSDGKLLISRELMCDNVDCANENGKTCNPIQLSSNYAFPGTTSHMNCADLGVSGVVEKGNEIIRGPFTGKLKCNTECKIDTSDCRRLDVNGGQICLLSEVVEFNQSVSSVDSKCSEQKGEIPCGGDTGRGCISGQTCKLSSERSYGTCVPNGNNIGTQCAAFCGDEIIDSGEQCDGLNLNGTSCVGVGALGGILSCNSSCQFDESKCSWQSSGSGCTNSSYPLAICSNGGTCTTDLSSDLSNCGACNNKCASGQKCSSGQCVSECAV